MQPPMPERRVGFGLDLLGHQAVLSFWFGVPPQRNPIPYIKSYIYIYILLYNELGLEFTLGSLWVCTGWHTRHCCSSQLRVFSWAFSCILASKFHLPPPANTRNLAFLCMLVPTSSHAPPQAMASGEKCSACIA